MLKQFSYLEDRSSIFLWNVRTLTYLTAQEPKTWQWIWISLTLL